jgi:putative redox protein
MVEVTVEYEGSLRCTAVHGPSGTQIETDAPKDNMGKGERFSPTDLLATGLGSCILTILGIMAQRHNLDLSGTSVRVSKEMVAQPVRRIGKLAVEIRIPVPLAEEQKQRLISAAEACPVKKSLHPDIEIPMTWNWG